MYEVRAIGALLAAVLAAGPATAHAQIYLLVNDLGETIIVPPGERNPEAFILAKMNGRKGANWRMDHVETRKGCLARRSITAYQKPTKWVRGFGNTRAEAEQAAIAEARSATGVYTATPGNWEQGYCNREVATARQIDVPEIEQKFRREAR